MFTSVGKSKVHNKALLSAALASQSRHERKMSHYTNMDNNDGK